VQAGQLTSTNQPVPSLCLQLPGDQGTVLDNGIAQLNWQSDGNLVVVQGTAVLWESATSDADFGGNGGREFCLFSASGIQILSGTGAQLYVSPAVSSAQTLTLDVTCNLIITDAGGAMVWEAGVACSS
jgi:hypothetical protein